MPETPEGRRLRAGRTQTLPSHAGGSAAPKVRVVARLPVEARRSEHVEHDRVLERLDLVRDVRRDDHALTRRDDPLLAADDEAKPAGEDVRNLLVRVVMGRNERTLAQGYPGHRQPFGVDVLATDRLGEPLDLAVAPVPHAHAASLRRRHAYDPAVRHTRYGWWLEEAGPVEPTRPLDGNTTTDVVVVGGGYLGLWTAWQLKQLEPGLDVVVLDAGLAGHGPSGRNGGFVSTLWDDLPILRARVGDERAVEVCRASERAVTAIGEWCTEQAVDAWYTSGGTMQVATSQAQLGEWDDVVTACRAVGAPDEARPLSGSDVAARCGSPAFLGGMLLRTAANVQPARLSLGLRARVLAAGVRVHERTPVRRLSRNAVAETRSGRVRAGSAVLAANAATASFPGYRLSLAVASSHMVVTEPVPDVIEALGWVGGENIHDCRTLLHYLRTTRDGRIALGWGGGRMGVGGRHRMALDVDATATANASAALRRFFPQLRERRITHGWGGPIDVSPTHLPIFGSHGRVHHGFGFTGNGVGPSYLGGQILARLALDRRDALTSLAIVEPVRRLMPPEPIRFVGGTLIREGLVRRDAALDDGRQPDAVSSFVSGLPGRLGLRLPR
jgi:glycine/D-amino acid oxidase-like deaminating enzyme